VATNVVTLTKEDYQNTLAFMNRATVAGLDEVKTLAVLAFKIEALRDAPAAPPPGPPGKNRQSVDESNVIELFPNTTTEKVVNG
jgi:hypothetical protein